MGLLDGLFGISLSIYLVYAMKIERHWTYGLLFCLLLSPFFSTAQEATFEVYTDARQALLNSYFEVGFTLRNGEGRDFKPPAFRDFKVVSGPSRSVSTTIINGAVSKEMSYSYTLQPKRVGNFTIGSASIRVDNQELRTRPVSIEVIEGDPGAVAGAEGELFVRAEPSVREAWIGQQIVLSYRLYTTVNIDNYNVLEESDYAGFYAEDIRRINGRVVREIINGKQYATKLLRQVALYPQQTGTLTIDPMEIQMGVVADGSDRRRGFFFNRQIKRVPVQTEPVTIEVRSLPAGAPPSFTGAVGKYKMTSAINRRQLTTDDVLQLTLNISGDGDIKRVQSPKIDFPEPFDVYDPKVTDERRYENGERIIGRKTIEYLVLPTVPGQYEVQPAFTYFDPDSARYITLNAEVYSVEVEPGSARPRSARPLDETAADEPREIKYIKMDDRVYRTDRGFFGSNAFWGLTLLPFLLLGVAVGYKNYLVRKAGIDPLLLRTKRARKVALKRLRTAEYHLKAKDSRAFYDEISKAMLGYVCDKLQIPRSELTKDNVRAKLQTLRVSESLTEDFMQIIRNTEMALFAGMDNADAMEETYRKTLEVLTGIEESIE